MWRSELGSFKSCLRWDVKSLIRRQGKLTLTLACSLKLRALKEQEKEQLRNMRLCYQLRLLSKTSTEKGDEQTESSRIHVAR